MGRTILLAVFVTAAVMAVAPSALAKGPLQVCGASGCVDLGPETDTSKWLGNAPGASSVAPPAPAPYFVLRFGDFGGPQAYWIPSVSMLRTFQSTTVVWAAVAPETEAALVRLTTGLQPYAAPRGAVAFVDYDNVKRGETYLRLYTIGTPVASPPATTEWLGIWLHGGTSPWNDGMSSFWISKKGSLLKRDGQVLRISPAIAKRIRAHLPLA
ncbi:MAG: hypothetical protein JWM06_1150 [Actinomycetia bacterium]|nr:hypothetical protein [Actinomycetes bacterium]